MGCSAGDYQQTTAPLKSESDFQIKSITQTMKDPRADQRRDSNLVYLNTKQCEI